VPCPAQLRVQGLMGRNNRVCWTFAVVTCPS
jgi:hypothetical protein